MWLHFFLHTNVMKLFQNKFYENIPHETIKNHIAYKCYLTLFFVTIFKLDDRDLLGKTLRGNNMSNIYIFAWEVVHEIYKKYRLSHPMPKA